MIHTLDWTTPTIAAIYPGHSSSSFNILSLAICICQVRMGIMTCNYSVGLRTSLHCTKPSSASKRIFCHQLGPILGRKHRTLPLFVKYEEIVRNFSDAISAKLNARHRPKLSVSLYETSNSWVIIWQAQKKLLSKGIRVIEMS